MMPRIRPMVAIVLILVFCRAAMDQGEAKVVHSGKNGPINPSVEEGGYHLPSGPPIDIPYSYIGAMQSGYGWFSPCVLWSWNLFSPFRPHRHRPIAPLIRVSPRQAPLMRLPAPVR
jgi:hypothetical protein